MCPVIIKIMYFDIGTKYGEEPNATITHIISRSENFFSHQNIKSSPKFGHQKISIFCIISNKKYQPLCTKTSKSYPDPQALCPKNPFW